MDYELRAQLRRSQSDVDVAQRARYLALRIRSGGLNPHRVRQAAALGDPAALLLVEPAAPTDKHCNYASASRGEFAAIGFNDVDGVLGWIPGIQLVQVAIDFLRHGFQTYYRLEIGRELISTVINLSRQWYSIIEARDVRMNQIFSTWGAGESRDDFYSRTDARAIAANYDAQLHAIAEDLRADQVELMQLALPEGSSESEIRWAASYLCRIIDVRYNDNLSTVWIAVHCRLAAGDGSTSAQEMELAWQRQYLIDWLLS